MCILFAYISIIGSSFIKAIKVYFHHQTLKFQKINEVETLKEIKRAIFDINDADEFQRFLKSRIQVS